MTSLTKNPETQNQKFIFIADSKTWRVFWGLEQLSDAIGWGVVLLLRHMKYAWF